MMNIRATFTKALVLRRDFPADLGSLPELVDSIGGLKVWQGK